MVIKSASVEVSWLKQVALRVGPVVVGWGWCKYDGQGNVKPLVYFGAWRYGVNVGRGLCVSFNVSK